MPDAVDRRRARVDDDGFAQRAARDADGRSVPATIGVRVTA